MSKITKAENELRVNKVVDFLIQGYTAQEILQYTTKSDNQAVAEKQRRQGLLWDVSIRQIYHYIKQANDRIKETTKIDRELLISKNKNRLELLFNKTLKIQDYKTALATVKELNAFYGIEKGNSESETDVAGTLTDYLKKLQENDTK